MTQDRTLAPLNRVFVPGLDRQTSEALNARLESYHRALDQLRERVVVDPAHEPPKNPENGQIELADGENWDPTGTGAETLVYYYQGAWVEILDGKHLNLTPPDYAEDPHQQYWHKVTDAAFCSMVIENPRVYGNGDIIDGWDRVMTEYLLLPNLSAGTVAFSPENTGIFNMSIYLALSGDSRGSYEFDMFVEGQPAGLDFALLFGNQQADGHFSESRHIVVNVPTVTAIDLRCISASSNFTVERASITYQRFSQIPAGTSAGTGIEI